MKKILGITGIRSDYDLLSGLYRRLAREPGVDFRVLALGAHLSRSFGHSIDSIIRDEVPILLTVESLIDSDSLSSRIKSASIALQNSIDIVAHWSPELILYAGDREEVLIGALLGTHLEIPTVHFYGGDHTVSGHMDNPVRHAASKLSTVHMVTMEVHKRRLIAMGEAARRIHVIGNLSLDNIVAAPPMPLTELRRRLSMPEGVGSYALVLFHPDPSEKAVAGQYLGNIIDCVLESGFGACVGYPNTDPANGSIVDAMNRFRGHERCYFYKNLDRDLFIALYRAAEFIIGNSSSGILEAASIGLPAISVGVRQRGRLAGSNVIFADADKRSINAAIQEVCRPEFLATVRSMTNPYGDGRSVERALGLLLTEDFASLRLKTEDPLELVAEASSRAGGN